MRELAKRFCLSLSTVYRIIQNGERKKRAFRCSECGALLEELPCRACQIKKRLKQKKLPGREYYAQDSRVRTSGRRRKRQNIRDKKLGGTPLTQPLVLQDELKQRLELLIKNPFELQIETEQDVPPPKAENDLVGQQDEKRPNETVYPLCALELRPREYKRYLEVRRQREQALQIGTARAIQPVKARTKHETSRNYDQTGVISPKTSSNCRKRAIP